MENRSSSPGDPAKSRLIRAVSRQGDFPMPPKKALPPEAVEALTEWVKSGAAVPSDLARKSGPDPRNHWAFQPVKLPPVPQIGDEAGDPQTRSMPSSWPA